MKTFIKILASGFGSGYLPVASGTWGTGFAALVYWFFLPKSNVSMAVIAFTALFLSVPVCTEAEKLYGKKDDSRIVLDEIIGFWITMLFVPFSLKAVIAGFFLFRLFDVWKPFFVRRIQSWRGGWGIVGDDFFAGIFSNIALQVIFRILVNY